MGKNNKVLVTGGCGFIGSHLVEELVNRGYSVRVLDNLSRGRLSYLKGLIEDEKIEFIDGDIRYDDAVNSAMDDMDYVFHAAATNINRSLSYPQESFDVNFNGSRVVFKSALDHNVKKVIFSSSASVYGEPKKLPVSENSRLNPITPYCVSKLSSEYLLAFLSQSGLKHITLRYFNVYGTRQCTDAYYTSVIILFIKRLLSGKPPIILGSGEQSMDFVNVRDVVQANILAMESDVSNEVFNVGTGTETSIKKLAELIVNSVGVDLKPIFEKRKVIVKRRRADISKIRRCLGFKPKITLQDGLSEVIDDIKKNPQNY